MNEEERKAVEILNTFELRRKTKNYKEISLEDSQSVEILLNLIGKLLKENKYMHNELDKQQTIINKYAKENELLRKDIEGWKKYCEEINEEQTEMSNKNCELEFEVEKLQKENEELKFKERSRIIGKYGDVEIHDVINRTLSNDYISVKKIKDIIDRIDYDIKKTKEIISNNSNIYTSDRRNDYQIVRLRAMNTKSLDIKKRLQELIEESGEK